MATGLHRRDGSVMTWADAVTGGDSTAVKDQLQDVQEIQSTGGAFAAILGDGSLVTWGVADEGGDGSRMSDGMKTAECQKNFPR